MRFSYQSQIKIPKEQTKAILKSKEFPESQGHPKITVFGEICVRESQTALRISVLGCQTATDFFTKTSPKRFATREK